MSAHLQREIDHLKKHVLSLCALVEDQVEMALRAVLDRDEALAREVEQRDLDIDHREIEVEEECLKALALYQPVAVDLRLIIATLKINNDLERIGDMAVNIAHKARALIGEPPVELSFDLGAMWDKTQAMLRDSIDALVNMDAEQATEVCRRDDEVDQMKYQSRIEIEEPDCPTSRPGEGLPPPAGGLPQPGADRRPGHQHRRRRGLPGGRPHHSPPQQAVVVAAAGGFPKPPFFASHPKALAKRPAFWHNGVSCRRRSILGGRERRPVSVSQSHNIPKPHLADEANGPVHGQTNGDVAGTAEPAGAFPAAAGGAGRRAVAPRAVALGNLAAAGRGPDRGRLFRLRRIPSGPARRPIPRPNRPPTWPRRPKRPTPAPWPWRPRATSSRCTRFSSAPRSTA